MATLNKKLQQKAEEELNEKPGRREQDIDILRKLVTSNKGQYVYVCVCVCVCVCLRACVCACVCVCVCVRVYA